MKWIIMTAIALVLQLFLPWWSIILAGFAYGALFIQSPRKMFLGGFLAIFFLWGMMAVYITWVNDGILASRLASLFFLPHGLFAVLVTALAGGLAGGVSAFTGNVFRSMLSAIP